MTSWTSLGIHSHVSPARHGFEFLGSWKPSILSLNVPSVTEPSINSACAKLVFILVCPPLSLRIQTDLRQQKITLNLWMKIPAIAFTWLLSSTKILIRIKWNVNPKELKHIGQTLRGPSMGNKVMTQIRLEHRMWATLPLVSQEKGLSQCPHSTARLFGHLLSLPLCGQACRGQCPGWVPCLKDSQQPWQRRRSVYWLNLDMENYIGARRNLAHGQ